MLVTVTTSVLQKCKGSVSKGPTKPITSEEAVTCEKVDKKERCVSEVTWLVLRCWHHPLAPRVG